VKLLSRQNLEAQLESPGATWLDRAQVNWGRGGIGGISTRSSAFANELDTAFQQRRTWLIEQGYAELRQDEQKTSIIYKRRLSGHSIWYRGRALMRRSGESVLRGACLAAAELIGMLGEAVGLEDDLSKGAQQIPNLEHY